MTDIIGTIYAKNGTELSWPIRPSVVYDEHQIEQRCDQICRWVYIKNNIELLWPIELGLDYDKNQITQQRDRSYICNLRKKKEN